MSTQEGSNFAVGTSSKASPTSAVAVGSSLPMHIEAAWRKALIIRSKYYADSFSTSTLLFSDAVKRSMCIRDLKLCLPPSELEELGIIGTDPTWYIQKYIYDYTTPDLSEEVDKIVDKIDEENLSRTFLRLMETNEEFRLKVKELVLRQS